ncbi:chemical-damaging agent resistance protein C [Spirochaetia bacterium]|nr:chemical-damaging agent resistance protein C [Spirochaetia bacterium]
MAINLSKGQKIDLTKGNAGLKKLFVGLGWDTNKYDGGDDFDLDASAFLLKANGKAREEGDFVFYRNLKHSSGSVWSDGDNRDGGGDGDDEVIHVDLSLVPEDIDKIDFTVTIDQAEARKQNFGQVSNAYVRVVNEETNSELIRYDLAEEYSVETALIAAELYREGAEWKFNAIGNAFKGGLAGLVRNFGLDA